MQPCPLLLLPLSSLLSHQPSFPLPSPNIPPPPPSLLLHSPTIPCLPLPCYLLLSCSNFPPSLYTLTLETFTPPQGAVGQLESKDPVRKFVATPLLQSIFNSTGAQLHMCLPAHELAWNFTTDLLHALHINEVLQLTNEEPPDWISIQPNKSVNGSKPSIVHTGVGHIHQLGHIIQWNGHYKKLNIWPGETANYINGTEGIVFPPQHGHKPLEVFIDNALRSFPLTYKGSAKPLGLETHCYQLPYSVYESAFSNPDNARWGSWNPDGMFYVGVTQAPPAPVFSSKPHFLDGDDILLEKVHGLSPNRDLHDTFMDVEPITGANVQFSQQFQVNFQVNQTSVFE